MSQTIILVPQPGMNWTNAGSAGSSCNATCGGSNAYAEHANKGPTWWYGTHEYTCIPANGYTNNQNAVSWEIGFHYTAKTGRGMQKIWDKAVGGYGLYIDETWNCFTLNRACTAGGSRWWSTPANTANTGHDYYLQIGWNAGTNPATAPAPVVYVAWDSHVAVGQSMADHGGSGTTAWYNDSVGSANIGNYSAGGGCPNSSQDYYLNGWLYIYRQYDFYADFGYGAGSWATDKWRWLGQTQTPTTCSINATNMHPAIGAVYQMYGHLQTTGGAAVPNQPLTVFWSTDGGGTWHWSDNFTTTNSNGDYSYDQTAIQNIYEYLVFYATGNYAGCSSPVINVVATTPTSIVLSVDNNNPNINQDFTLSYVLRDQYLTGLASKSVDLWEAPPGEGYSLIYTTTTDGNGYAQHTLSKAAAGTYTYAIVFNGDTAYANSTSNYIPVTVMGAQPLTKSETDTINTNETSLPKFTITEIITLSPTETILVGFTKTETDTLI